jgi:hypothetical protein
VAYGAPGFCRARPEWTAPGLSSAPVPSRGPVVGPATANANSPRAEARRLLKKSDGTIQRRRTNKLK